ncbi:MAG: hypothetical protein WBH47_21830, partial [Streptosporangiaceae bacterium]
AGPCTQARRSAWQAAGGLPELFFFARRNRPRIAEGWRIDPGGRRPISLRTIYRLTRLGRPPIS